MSLFAVCSTNLVILRLAFVFLKLHIIVLKSLGTFCAYQQGLSNAPLASCSYALKEKLLKLKVSLETRFHEILKHGNGRIPGAVPASSILACAQGAYSSSMADPSSVVLELCKFIYAAADAVKSHKQLSKRLKARVERLEQPLLQKVKRLPSFVSVAEELLTAIHEFLKKRKKKKVIQRYLQYQEITACFAEFRERLNELVADSQFVEAEVVQAEVLQAERDDFEQQQVIIREQLSLSRAHAVNKQLQSGAPREFAGFCRS
jgi:hypothetical protein